MVGLYIRFRDIAVNGDSKSYMQESNFTMIACNAGFTFAL